MSLNFIDRVLKYKEILKEVETTPLDETFENFHRDVVPERELLIWEDIASAYEEEISNHPEYSLEEKKAVFSSLLTGTLKSDE
ncbi:hypothetical protein FJ364_03345 [Candidatus Dependentiae bacterium]|nr:hypothetical protein [Candidatus Dependentiae bacterium]